MPKPEIEALKIWRETVARKPGDPAIREASVKLLDRAIGAAERGESDAEAAVELCAWSMATHYPSFERALQDVANLLVAP